MADDVVVTNLLDRISALEDENRSLRRLEDTIRYNNYLFDVFLSLTHDGIALLTPELRFLRLIHSAFGYAESEVLGQPILAYLHPEDQGSFREAFSTLLEGPKRTNSVVCRARQQRGEWSWAQFQMTDMLDDPQVQAIILSYRLIPPPEWTEVASFSELHDLP